MRPRVGPTIGGGGGGEGGDFSSGLSTIFKNLTHVTDRLLKLQNYEYVHLKMKENIKLQNITSHCKEMLVVKTNCLHFLTVIVYGDWQFVLLSFSFELH